MLVNSALVNGNCAPIFSIVSHTLSKSSPVAAACFRVASCSGVNSTGFGFGFTTILKILQTVVSGVVSFVSPELRSELTDVINNFHKKAVASGNPWDTILSTLLADVLGITLS